ncbi:TPA: DUF1090 domain-containing protein [Salmonella enterica subsp. enterica serovar Muenchen]|nr:DUF1090 domain-containing protein [Salmonella enterica]
MKPQYLRATILTGLIYSVMSPGAVADVHHECEYKRQHLEHQLEYAQAYNNIHRMAGLQHALRNINEHCADGRLPQQKEKKVADKQRKIKERQYELELARISGKSEKIANKQAKLAKARRELSRSTAP